MVVYHWGNYFLGNVPYFYEVLRFLTPSFIFITGAIIGLISTAKYARADSRAYRRLAGRGAKLLLLFTALNLGIQFLLPDRSRGATFQLPAFTEDLYAIFVTGNSFSASFKVLLPIAYLLLLSALFLQTVTWRPAALALLVVATVVLIQAAEFLGWVSSNLMLVSFGFLGICLHAVGIDRITHASNRLLPLLLLYAVSLLLLFRFGMQYWAQLFNVTVSLLLIYGFGSKLKPDNAWVKIVIQLGIYSLFAYVAQIGILQVMKVVATRLFHPSVASLVVLPAALILTVLAVSIVQWARKNAVLVDKAYRLVFS